MIVALALVGVTLFALGTNKKDGRNEVVARAVAAYGMEPCASIPEFEPKNFTTTYVVDSEDIAYEQEVVQNRNVKKGTVNLLQSGSNGKIEYI